MTGEGEGGHKGRKESGVKDKLGMVAWWERGGSGGVE